MAHKLPSYKRMPATATRVYEGVIFDVYAWDQEMYDGSFVRFERVIRPDTVVVISITEQGTILVIEDEQPAKGISIGMPGGRIEPGEDPRIAGIRELQEETGYSAKSCELWYSEEPTSKLDWTVFYYIAKGCTKTHQQSLDGGERIKVMEYTLDDFITLMLSDADFDGSIALKVTKMIARGELNAVRDLFKQ
jgi:ADP-ribose pyrophosphatase